MSEENKRMVVEKKKFTNTACENIIKTVDKASKLINH